MDNKLNVAQGPLPRLIPSQGTGYNLTKKIVSYVFAVNKTHTLYHAWLDSLFNVDFKYEDILNDLRPLLDTPAKRNLLGRRRVIVIGHKFSDGSIRPNGSSFILLPNNIREHSRDYDFELDILNSKVHMKKVSIEMLRADSKENPLLIFADSYRDIIGVTPKSALVQASQTIRDAQGFDNLRVAPQVSQPVISQQRPVVDGLDSSVIRFAMSQPTNSPSNNLPSNNLPSTSTSYQTSSISNPGSSLSKKPALVRIKSRERATEISNRYSNNDYKFMRLRCSGIQQITPQTLEQIFPGCRVSWHDIFINGHAGNSVSAVIAINNINFRNIDHKGRREINIGDSQVVANFCVINSNDFRSVVLNIRLTYEYQSKMVSAKRKASPSLDETPVSANPTPIPQSLSESMKEKSPKETPMEVSVPMQQHSPKALCLPISSPDLTENSAKEFVAITAETRSYVLRIIDKFESENRLFLVIVDPVFSSPKPSMNAIRSKFESAFGPIGDDCVLIKSDMSKLMMNLSQANEQDFLRCDKNLSLRGEACLICHPAIKLEHIFGLASDHKIIWGSITVDCVRASLEKDVYLMKREALLNAGAPLLSVVDLNQRPPVGKVNQSNKSSNIVSPKTDSSKKRNRIAAALNQASCLDNPVLQPIQENNFNDRDFEAKLRKKVEEETKKCEFVTNLLPKLQKFGNAVVRIDNLPAKLTIHALKLMMGIYTITCEQVVAVILASKGGKDLMNIRIVMESDSEDMKKILFKNNWKTAYESTLLIKRTDLKELETFLKQNHGRIRRLNADDKLPMNEIGYGNPNYVQVLRN